jgi:LacI family transcriptional regulator
MTPTILDIAKKVKVNDSTVSRILNNSPQYRYATQTVEKVKKAAEEMGYQANHFARSLKTGKTNTIGVIGTARLQEIDDIATAAVFAGIGRVVDEHNNFITIMPLGNDLAEDMVVKAARSRIVDGLIIQVFSFNHDHFVKVLSGILQEARFPFVAIHATGMDFPCPNVGFNSVKAGGLGAVHLLEQGVKDIAFVTTGRSYFADEMYRGYAQAMEKAGARPDRLVLEEQFFNDAEMVRRRIGKHLGTAGIREAYFCFSDTTAYGLIRALEEKGARVPEDVLVIGVDNLIRGKYLETGLTSIDRKLNEQGEMAARMLFEQINGKRPLNPMTYIAEPELVVRKSSLKPRA